AIDGRLITVRWHGETIQSTVDACNFRRGHACQMKYASRKARGFLLGDREQILIDLPPLYQDVLGNVRSYTTVAVGYTDESLQAWTVALGLNGRDSHETDHASTASE
ncbi:MAG TPA: hypothetical protein DDW52_22625, partial [Planctomycetaceae bacterium]|nr:hypothetical protein [Planctomycetaceae bacterium]